MKDIAQLQHIQPQAGRGTVTINYTDPLTQKIKEQIKGHNHVHLGMIANMRDFQGALDKEDSALRLVLTDSTAAIDTDFPFIKGHVIGYGRQTKGSVGLYQGAWNASLSQYLTLFADRMYTKQTYDFTPAQVPTEVKTVGFTSQSRAHNGEINSWNYTGAQITLPRGLVNTAYGGQYTVNNKFSAGRGVYAIASGVVTVTDLFGSAARTYDISGAVGTGATLGIGRNDVNGKMYIKDTNAAVKKVYEYADDTFSTLLNTYTVSAMTTTTSNHCFGVYGSLISVPAVGKKIDFSANTETDIIAWSLTDAEKMVSGVSSWAVGYNHSIVGKYMLPNSHNSLGIAYAILDLSLGEYTIHFSSFDDDTPAALIKDILRPSNGAVLQLWGDHDTLCRGAIAQYRVPDDAPARPAGYGMTITYELELFI